MRKQITTTIDKNILKKSKRLAVDSDMNLNDIIENSLELWLILKSDISLNEIDDIVKVYDRLPSDGIGSEIRKILMLRMDSLRELERYFE